VAQLFSLGHMSTPTKSYVATGWLRLLLIDGFMMLVCSIPWGFGIALVAHYQNHLDWFWAMIGGVIMAVAIAIIGGIFLGLGVLIMKRRIKKQESSHDVA